MSLKFMVAIYVLMMTMKDFIHIAEMEIPEEWQV